MILWILGFQVFVFGTEHASIQIETSKDYQILDLFFHMGIAEEGYGYVLDGTKPISIRNFYPLDQFPISKDFQYSEKEFINSLLVQQAIPIWNKRLSGQKRFILKAVDLTEPKSNSSGLEVQFINSSAIKTVIDDNINLFRYVLGPNTTTDQLVNQISCSQEPFSKIFHNDCVLIGIVLGFGAHNSLVGGRLDEILTLSISKDSAPFTPKSGLITSKKEHSLKYLTPERYGGYYLGFAGGDDSIFRTSFSPLHPRLGFSTIEDELLALNSLKEPLPEALLEQSPAFVFGTFKGGESNQPLYKKLQTSQKKTQALLKQPDFLERVLEKIGGEKHIISYDKPLPSEKQQHSVFPNMDTKEWIRILQGALVFSDN